MSDINHHQLEDKWSFCGAVLYVRLNSGERSKEICPTCGDSFDADDPYEEDGDGAILETSIGEMILGVLTQSDCLQDACRDGDWA